MAKRRRQTPGWRSETVRQREERWRGILNEQEASGLSPAAFCLRESISQSVYYWWKKTIRERDEKSRKDKSHSLALVPVRVTAAHTAGPTTFDVVLSNERVLRVPTGFDPESLKRLIALLENGAC